jgi:hypothetical protein
VRFLRRARELAYRDLGGLVFNLHRFGQRNDELVLAKLSTLTRLDAELRALESSLDEAEALTVLREAGVSACPRCAAIHSSEDRFCPACGLPMSRRVDLPIAGPASTPATDAVSAAAGASAQAAHGAAGQPGAPASAAAADSTGAGAPPPAAPLSTRPSTSAAPAGDPTEQAPSSPSPAPPSPPDRAPGQAPREPQEQPTEIMRPGGGRA